ncbi:hypothetical protein HC891_23195 [Candidatus Gracilibacteria bacterium]|nr:hypothetical protein [Candidatus Gracilibacteria bacterium]
MVDDRFGQLHQVAVGRLQRVSGLLALLARNIHDPLHSGLGRRGGVLHLLLAPAHRVLRHRLHTPQHAGDDAHAIVEQRAVTGMMDIGLNDGAIDAQFPPRSDLQLAGQGGHVVEQALQRRRLNEFGPADQGGVVGYPLGIDPLC